MKIMSTKEEWLMNLIIDSMQIQRKEVQNADGSTGYVVNMFLSGIPKTQFDADIVLELSGKIQNLATKFIDEELKENSHALHDTELLDRIKPKIRDELKNSD